MFRRIGHWHQIVPQLRRPTLGRAQRPVLILLLVVLRAGIHVFLPVAQHGVDEPGQLVRRGGDGLGRIQMGFLPAEEGAQGTVGTVQRVGRQTQGCRGSARAALGLGADHPAAGDAVVGAQPQPGYEVLGAGPFGHVGPDLADHFQGRVRVHAVDAGQVHSRHPVQMALDIEARRVLLVALFAIGSWRLAVTAVLKPLQLGFDLPVALGNLALVRPIQPQGLGQLEDVLVPPMPSQRPGDGLLVGLAPPLTILG